MHAVLERKRFVRTTAVFAKVISRKQAKAGSPGPRRGSSAMQSSPGVAPGQKLGFKLPSDGCVNKCSKNLLPSHCPKIKI